MNSSGALTTTVAGLAFGFSLIVAIGAQNSFVLRQGALRRHVLAVVVICSLSDVLLIGLGVAGAGATLVGQRLPGTVVRWLGAALLLAYAALAARRALRAPAPRTGHSPAVSRGAVVAACLAFTWLNPAVYLDTVVLLGSVANSRPGHQWWFAGGAAIASVVWFTALGFGARLLAPALRRPSVARVLDGFIAVVMTETALRVLVTG